MKNYLLKFSILAASGFMVLGVGCHQKNKGILCNEESLEAFSESVSLKKTYRRLQLDSRATSEAKQDVANSQKVSSTEFNQQSHQECQVQIKTQESDSTFSTKNQNITTENIEEFSLDPRFLSVGRNELNQPILVLSYDLKNDDKKTLELSMDPIQLNALRLFEYFHNQSGITIDGTEIQSAEQQKDAEKLLIMIQKSTALRDLFSLMKVNSIQIVWMNSASAVDTTKENESIDDEHISSNFISSKIEVLEKISKDSETVGLGLRLMSDITEEEIIIGLANYERTMNSKEIDFSGSHLSL